MKASRDILEVNNELIQLGFNPIRIEMKQSFLDELINQETYELKNGRYYIYGLPIRVNNKLEDNFNMVYGK